MNTRKNLRNLVKVCKSTLCILQPTKFSKLLWDWTYLKTKAPYFRNLLTQNFWKLINSYLLTSFFLMKHLFGIVFSNKNIDGNEKSALTISSSLRRRGNETVVIAKFWSLNIYTFIYQKHYFVHFCSLFLKLLNTFSVSQIMFYKR